MTLKDSFQLLLRDLAPASNEFINVSQFTIQINPLPKVRRNPGGDRGGCDRRRDSDELDLTTDW